MNLTVGSLFSGIGGGDLGLQRAGFKIAWQVENDEFCTRVLQKHWPNVPKYGDVRDVGGHNLEWVDFIHGGFPCQPVSVAGKRRAQEDERWLWPEFARIVRELRPWYVLVENVPGLLVRGMGDVLGDLAASGYDAEWQSLPAAAFGAPHIRERVFIVAHARCQCDKPRRTLNELATTPRARKGQASQRQRIRNAVVDSGKAISDTDSCGFEMYPQSHRAAQQSAFNALGRMDACGRDRWAPEPGVCRVANGVPAQMDRLRGLGNAEVPQVVEWIGRRIIEAARQPGVGAVFRNWRKGVDE